MPRRITPAAAPALDEHRRQVLIVHYLHHALNGLPATFFAVPNGANLPRVTKGKTTFVPQMKKLKAEGLTPGVADLCLIYRGRFIGLEVKTDRTKQSQAQTEWQARLEAAGGSYYLVRGVDDVFDALVDQGIPIRARPSQTRGRLYDPVGGEK